MAKKLAGACNLSTSALTLVLVLITTGAEEGLLRKTAGIESLCTAEATGLLMTIEATEDMLTTTGDAESLLTTTGATADLHTTTETTERLLTAESSSAPYNLTKAETVSAEADLHMRIVYVVVGVLGMSGNGLVALVIAKTPSMRRSFPNMFIINQSFLDFTVAFLIVTNNFFRDIGWVNTHLGKDVLCRVWLSNYPLWGIFTSSTYNLVFLTYERYFAIVHPIRHSLFTRRQIRFALAAAWLTGLLVTVPFHIPSSKLQDGECSIASVWPSEQYYMACGLFTITMEFFVPLVLITLAYGQIAYTLRKAGIETKEDSGEGVKRSEVSSTRGHRLTKARKNVIKMLATVAAAFVLCWSWNQIYMTLYFSGIDLDLQNSFYHLTVVAVLCNSCLNPLIYSLRYEQFQKALKHLFRIKVKSEESVSAGRTEERSAPRLTLV